MLHKLIFTLTALLFVFSVESYAQTNVSAEKQAAVKELLTLVNANNKTEDIVTMMTAQMENTRKATIKTVLDERTDLTPNERTALEQTLINETGVRIKRIQERLIEKLDFFRMIDEVFISVYDKHYTLEEIRDLITFYKTPTGQKSLKVSPQLMNDAMVQITERMVPKIPEVMKELQDEERKEIEQQVNKKKPRPGNRES